MNVLIVSTGGHIGGEETFTKNLAINLLKRSHSVWVAPGGKVQMNDLMKRHILIADIDTNGRTLKGLFRGAKVIKSFVEENRIDIVHCQAAGPAIMGGIIKKMNWDQGEKWIYHDHGIGESTYKWLPIFLNLLDLTITVSDFELNKLKSNGVKEHKIVRVHSGIDPKEYNFEAHEKINNRDEIIKEFGISERDYVIGYIGRLSPEKGCDLILPAIQNVLQKNNSVRSLIVGDGILRSSMENTAKVYNMTDKVIFTGFRRDIPKILCCFDALLLPSNMEAFGLTALEAMASGVPVIASDAGGIPELVIPGFNGSLFETGNYIALGTKILEIINNGNLKKLGNNGKEYVEKYFNVNRMVNEIEFYYNNIL